MNPYDKAQFVKDCAKKHGFLSVGVAKAEFMADEAKILEQWLKDGNHASMEYMSRHFDKRVDPTLLVPGAKSVISLSYNYFTSKKQTDTSVPKISKYAYGRDYHKVVKQKLKKLTNDLQVEFGSFSSRSFVDSAPVMERDWAKRAGLGWTGKHTLLLSKKQGSFFFLAEIICDLELHYDNPVDDHCGECTKCIDACPTNAISPQGYVLDAGKCISYLTIELKEAIPIEFKDKMENWMFGCDICQDVCPWNRFAHQHNEPEFEPREKTLNLSRQDWKELTKDTFDQIFEGSAVKRTKYEGLQRNITFLTE
jgi:epoxyqueuosine reductase